jgi:hypothetical protein
MLSITPKNLLLWKLESVYAYQLRHTDYVPWYGVYRPIEELAGVCTPDVPLGVYVRTFAGERIMPFNLELEILRYHGE